jgi:squalene-hopene/tetraprenyl-beta-curcumene cyclase
MTSRVCANAAHVGAVERASAFLLVQADQQFAEARHVMKFSRAAGFTGTSEEQSGDIFARATLANLFLDIASLGETPELAAALRGIARREAEYIAHAKVVNRAGGWSYFPDLPELPPDADSLAAALSLFVRIAPEYTELCREPVELVLAGADADGSFETWIVAPEDAPSDRTRMQWAIQSCWGSGPDPDVLAHLYYALWLWAPARYGHAIRLGASKLIEMQQPNGAWRATWYVAPAYGTGLAVRLLLKIGMGGDARGRAYRYLADTQREDGAWGDESSAPLQTALSMSALRDAEPGSISSQMVRGAAALRAHQQADGSWLPSPWIQMEIGRATGKILRVAKYQSATLTTAFCLRALLLAGSSAVAVTAP